MDGEVTELGRRSLHRDMVAAFGTAALRGRDLDPLFDEASRLVASGLGTPFAKVLEYLPREHEFLVRAGCGWHDGVVGHARLGAGDQSPAGHALHSAEPVLSNNLETEQRFRTPDLLLEHGIEGAINVIIQGDGVPFGVLEVDSQLSGKFLQADISFLQNVANLLGLAVERSRRENELERALAARDVLLREADHRIKNSLQLVASLLSMQRSRSGSPESADAFEAAINRVRAIAEAHRALFQSRDLRTVAFGRMLCDIGSYVGAFSPTIPIRCEAAGDLEIDAERAIPLGLIVNELLTNAIRHAYPGDAPGEVKARVDRDGDDLRIVVADGGIGLGPDPAPSRTLGGTIVRSLLQQIGARSETKSERGGGTVVTVRLKLEDEAGPASGDPASGDPASGDPASGDLP